MYGVCIGSMCRAVVNSIRQAAPNSATPDLFNPSAFFCPPSYNRPDLNLPCGGGSLNDLTAASRSRHPGGVNVLKADGSVHFVSQDIDLKTWQEMGSIQEVQP